MLQDQDKAAQGQLMWRGALRWLVFVTRSLWQHAWSERVSALAGVNAAQQQRQAKPSPPSETARPEVGRTTVHWLRFVAGTLEWPPKGLFLEVKLLIQERHKKAQAKKVTKLQGMMRRHAAQTLSAHQLLFHESQATLRHCNRFQNQMLVPVGLEEQCEQAMAKCQGLFRLDELDSQR